MSFNTSESIIEVRDLSKVYQIRHDGLHRPTFRDVMMNRIRHPFARVAPENFWALRNVSFEIPRGDVVGVIGRNGAGKSTLLKILSRVTDPSEGVIDLYGRVGSLLEVGTGFHPELTGRENIYLNGSILGMRRKEIDRQFDAIVAFAEVEQFLDTPVKRYSSGMYVRLAFAVAAHLETEILLVDEVLAVGDAEFQKKCLGKMSEVAHGGRTVLFVSHNMNAVEQLCSSVMLFERGTLKDYSRDVRPVIHRYLFGNGDESSSMAWTNSGSELRNEWFIPQAMHLASAQGKRLAGPVGNDEEIFVHIEGEVGTSDPSLNIGYAIYSEDGQLLYWTYHTDTSREKWPTMRRGPIALRSRLPRRTLNEGTYRIELIAGLHFRQWLFEPGVNAPSVFMTIQGGLSDSPMWMNRRPGLMAPVLNWELAS